MPTGGDIAADHCADCLGSLPAHITLMGVGHQRQPVGSRLTANLYADAGGAVSRRRCRLTIGAAVHRVLDHPVDGGVIRSPPGYIAIVLLHRQIEIVLVEPAERLPRTPQF